MRPLHDHNFILQSTYGIKYAYGIVLMLAGIIAGVLSGFVAVLLSLPLRSPDDLFFNSISVTLLSLATGLFAGLIWFVLRKRGYKIVTFLIVWSLFFWIIGTILLLVATFQLERVVQFLLPLMFVGWLGTTILTPVLDYKLTDKIKLKSAKRQNTYYLTSGLAIAIFIVFGWLLRNVGDFMATMLDLPAPR